MLVHLGLVVALCSFAPAVPQHGPPTASDEVEEKKKAEEQTARRLVSEYRAAAARAGNVPEEVEALKRHLLPAKPHEVIRIELGKILAAHPRVQVKLTAVSCLARYKKDAEAASILGAHARTQKDPQVQMKCLEVFGTIAPYRSSVELAPLVGRQNRNLALAEAALKAAEKVNSVRALPALVNLLGDLESIPDYPEKPAKEEELQKMLRKETLLAPTKALIQRLWKKCDLDMASITYKEGLASLQKYQSTLARMQEQEDAEDHQARR